MKSQKDILKQKISVGRVIPVIGAGVSNATSNLPGWKGLIEKGVQYATDIKLKKSEINLISESLNLNNLTEAAFTLKKLLNAPNHPYSDWLNEMFGSPDFNSMDLLNSIEELGCAKILTTNYDKLLSSFSPIMPKKVFDWSQHEEIIRAINNDDEFIFHLHGVFDKPETVIFGSDDYSNLSDNQGYKQILKEFWISNTLLFIGCSKDGVIDDDFITVLKFMKDWFPSLPNQHYILLSEKDFDLGVNEILLKEYNIQAISYGIDRKNLPFLIQELAGEKINFLLKTKKIQNYLEKRMPEALGGNESVLKELLQSVLPANGNWYESSQIEILDQALLKYNRSISSQFEKFRNYQIIVSGLVEISELNNRINLWNISGVIKKENQKSFIETALLAYNALKRFPVDILDVIRRKKPHLIHPYFFTNYLGKFVSDYNRLKSTKIELDKFYEHYEYFYENMKRIIESLKNLLELEPSEVFEPLAKPSKCSILPNSFIALVTDVNIRIYDFKNLKIPIALLPLEKNLKVRNIGIVIIDNTKYLFGYNSKYYFLWNPLSELYPKIVFEAKLDEEINNVYPSKLGNEIEICISTNIRLMVFHNFNLKEELPPIEKNIFLNFKSKGIYISTNDLDSFNRGVCIIKSNNLKDWTPLFTTQQLWENLLEFEDVKNLELKYLSHEEEKLELFLAFRPIKIIKIVQNNIELILCAFSFNILNEGGSCLFLIEVNKFKIVKNVYLPCCYALKITQLTDNEFALTANYFTGKISREIFFKLQINDQIRQIFDIEKNLKSAINIENDAFSVLKVNDNKVFVNVMGKRILVIDTNKMVIEESITGHENEYFGKILFEG